MVIGMVEQKVYCGDVGEHNQRQTHLRNSRMIIMRLSWVVRGKGVEGNEKKKNQLSQLGGPKVQKVQVTKMVGLYRGKQPREIRVGVGVCYSGPVQ